MYPAVPIVPTPPLLASVHCPRRSTLRSKPFYSTDQDMIPNRPVYRLARGLRRGAFVHLDWRDDRVRIGVKRRTARPGLATHDMVLSVSC